MTRPVLVLALAAALLAACGGSGPAVAATATDSPNGGPGATSAESAAAEATPEKAPKRFAVGDIIVVSKDHEDWAEITVTEASTVPEFKGDFNDTPKDGNVYLQAFVHYKALTHGVSYNPLDWDLFVDDVAMNDFTFVVNGPEPTLGSGELSKDREAEGWMVHEIPAEGEAVLSWKGVTLFDDPTLFEVVVREN
jgi:hypothetical protein